MTAIWHDERAIVDGPARRHSSVSRRAATGAAHGRLRAGASSAIADGCRPAPRRPRRRSAALAPLAARAGSRPGRAGSAANAPVLRRSARSAGSPPVGDVGNGCWTTARRLVGTQWRVSDARIAPTVPPDCAASQVRRDDGNPTSCRRSARRAPRRRAAGARAARPPPRATDPTRRRRGARRAVEPEELEEQRRRAVQDRAELRAAGLLDQPALDQRRGRGVGADAADARDLRARDRLQVGDDRERLGLRRRQRRGARLGQQAPRGLLGAGSVASVQPPASSRSTTPRPPERSARAAPQRRLDLLGRRPRQAVGERRRARPARARGTAAPRRSASSALRGASCRRRRSSERATAVGGARR